MKKCLPPRKVEMTHAPDDEERGENIIYEEKYDQVKI